MSRTTQKQTASAERAALHRQVKGMIQDLNAERWERCYSRIDPRLREKGTPEQATHAEQLRKFQQAYGGITPWHTRINLYLDAKSNKHDDRPFAYVYIVWKDAATEFHMFRERWVKDGEKWYTRVVGLLPAEETRASDD